MFLVDTCLLMALLYLFLGVVTCHMKDEKVVTQVADRHT